MEQRRRRAASLHPEGPGMQRGRGACREPVLKPEVVPAWRFLEVSGASAPQLAEVPCVLPAYRLQISVEAVSVSCPLEI